MTRWRIFAAGSVLAATAAMSGISSATAVATPQRSFSARSAQAAVALVHSAHAVTVKSVKVIDARQLLATIVPKALGRAITVRILLPVDYQPSAEQRYPVLYLYPGTSGHSSDWMEAGDAPKTTAPYRLITVSSDIGFNGDGGGWFTDWVDTHTALGPSKWETYDIHELIPWIDANFDTIRSRDGRGVAGLSQGGYGSTELAARHPDLFVMDGSFSGAPEIDRDPQIRAGAYGVIAATMSGLNGVEPDAPFGNPVTDQINWEGHDPATIVENLRPVRLWLATADGLPGKYDDPVTNPPGYAGAAAIESATHQSTDAFLQHVKAAHIPYYDYDYGSGTHTWPYWARDFRNFIGPLMQTFAHPPARPQTVYYTTIDQTWSAWGWRVSIKRSATQEFSTLSSADRTGFVLAGTGVASVVSPRFFDPGATVEVSVAGRKQPVRADADGHLHLTVPLGSSPTQVPVQFSETNAGR